MKRRYILTPDFAFRGWKLLPFAVQYLPGPRTEFFGREDWELVSKCDGCSDIEWEDLTDLQKRKYEHWERNGFIVRPSEGQKLFPWQEYVFYDSRFKESVLWSVTGRCNFRCRHCFMSAPHGVQGEPSWDDLMKMLDSFERCGIRDISLTGGEPLIRKDFWDLADEIRSRGMIVTMIYTNGHLVTEEFLDKLRERRMHPGIQFSFDGTGCHDWMRGVPGAEKTVIDALRRCRERGIRTSVSMAVCRENAGTIRESVNLMASLGVSSMKVCNTSPLGEWKDQSEHYLSQAELYDYFLEYLPHFFEDGKPLSLGLEGFFHYEKRADAISSDFEKKIPEKDFGRALMCGHVRRSMYVSPKGNVLPCMSMVGGPIEDSFPNMLETPLEEILDEPSLYMKIINFRISDYMEHHPECRKCKYKEECCGGCRAVAVRDGSTDYLAKDPVTCEYFSGGWKEKKDELLRSILKDDF